MITIRDAKEIREAIGATHLVVFAVTPDGVQHVSTHGETQAQAQEAADAGNRLKAALGWPANLNSKPLPRRCGNCVFWKEDRGVFTCTGWTGDGSRGMCSCDPSTSPYHNIDDLCRFFEPNG